MNRTARADRIRERRRILIALALAVLVHFLLLVLAVILLAIMAVVAPRPVPPPVPEPEPVEITIMPPPEPRKEERGFIDSSQNTVAEKAPENARFESDQNSVSASSGPVSGDKPIPSVDGEKRDAVTLRDQALTLGPSKVPAPPAPQPRKPQPQQEKPKEKTEEAPAPTPLPTPKPEDDLALLKPIKPRPTPEKEVRKAEPPSPPVVPRTPGFQPQTRTTKLTGGISNRGKASIEAVATPLGRYRKMMNDAIGSRWYYYVSEMLDMVNVGTVKITFIVRADGHVEKVRVLQNTSNQSLANCSMRSIIEAEIPPIPPEIAKTLQSNSLEVDYSFTIVPP